MADYKASIDLDSITLGEMERMEAGRISDMLAVFDKRLKIEGVEQEDVPAIIRDWTVADLREVSEAIGEQVEAETNPVRSGKN